LYLNKIKIIKLRIGKGTKTEATVLGLTGSNPEVAHEKDIK